MRCVFALAILLVVFFASAAYADRESARRAVEEEESVLTAAWSGDSLLVFTYTDANLPRRYGSYICSILVRHAAIDFEDGLVKVTISRGKSSGTPPGFLFEGFTTCQYDSAGKASALDALIVEEKVVRARWHDESLLVEVEDDEWHYDDFAKHVCDVIAEHGANVLGGRRVLVKIIETGRITERVLASAPCRA